MFIFIASQPKELNWSFFDFVAASILISFLGISLFLILRLRLKRIQKIITLSILILVFILIWLELAVGVFNSQISRS